MLCCVAIRMRAAPLPSAAHYGFQRLELRLPLQLALDAVGCRDQHRGIAWPPLHFASGNRMTRHAANGLDDLAHTESAAVTKVVDQLVALAQSIQRQQMRAGKVADMDVVAHAGPVGRGIVRTVNRYVLAL